MASVDTSQEQPGKAAVLKVGIETPLGPIRSQVMVDTGPMRLSQLAPSAFELTDIMVARANQREKDAKREISCRPGCGACCRQMVPVSVPEALLIHELLESFPEKVKGAFMSRFEKIGQALKAQKVFHMLLTDRYNDETVHGMARQYFSWQIPCPFLVRESCTIYEYRPVACREYNVTTAPDLCGDPFENMIRKIPMPMPLSMPLARVAAHAAPMEVRLIPLSLAPFWVDANSEFIRRSWPGMTLFKTFLDHLGPPLKPRENNYEDQERTIS